MNIGKWGALGAGVESMELASERKTVEKLQLMSIKPQTASLNCSHPSS